MRPAAVSAHRSAAAPARSKRLVLAMLLLAYTFNFLDRQILGILKEPIKAELGLTDSQLGLMGGVAFALLYTTVGVPVAWLADRASRSWIMTVALTLWSAFTMACGAATGFWSLFMARVGVGLGEAGGVAPAYSLISDTFPEAQQARAVAVYSFGIPIGSALGILFGGLLASSLDWRLAFVVVGGAGLLFAPIFKAVVRDPERGAFGAVGAPAASAPRFGAVLGLLAQRPTFWLLAFGAASASICGYGVAFWLPSFFVRSLGLSLVQTSWFYGSITLVGGTAGLWLGGGMADRFGARDRAAYAMTPAVCFLIALPLMFAAMNTRTLPLAFVLFLLPTGLNLAWFGPVVTAVQHLVPAPMRTTANAIFLLIVNLLGLAVGLWLFGVLSDRLAPAYGAESMRYALYAGFSLYVLASLLLWLASRRLAAEWIAG